MDSKLSLISCLWCVDRLWHFPACLVTFGNCLWLAGSCDTPAKAALVRPLSVPAAAGSSGWAGHCPGRNVLFRNWCSQLPVVFCRGAVWDLSLGVLRLCPHHLHYHDEPDPQVVPHVLWSSTLGHIPPGLAHHPAPEAPQDPPRVPTRDLLLHHHGYCHPAGPACPGQLWGPCRVVQLTVLCLHKLLGKLQLGFCIKSVGEGLWSAAGNLEPEGAVSGAEIRLCGVLVSSGH